MSVIIPLFEKELELEAVTTRKMLERIPPEKFDWKPHPKSMSLIRLATHVAEIPSWIGMTIDQDDINFDSSSYKPTEITDKEALFAYFESNLSLGRSALERGNDEMLKKIWTMRDGEAIWVQAPKAEVLYMTFAQVIHHRAQLGVYLRLLDIPIPGSYGPSADEA